MKLARKIVWVMLATFFGVFALLGYVDARRVLAGYHERSADELMRMGRALGPALAEVESVEGHARALQVLERAGNDPRVRLRWRPLGHLGGTNEPPLDEEQQAALHRGQSVSVERDATNRLYVFVPVDDTVSVLELSEDLTPRARVVTSVIARRLVLGGLAVLAAAGLAILAAVGIVGTPMRQLAHHAREIGAGDFSTRLSINRHDEIGELATEMSAMSERLAEAQKRIALEAADKIKALEQVRHADRLNTVGTLAAGIAHELGTPMGVIAGRAQMIANAPGASPDTVQFAKVISNQVERMTTIMRGLLGFARRTPSTRSLADLRELVRRILDLLEPLAVKQGVALELDAAAEAIRAEVDPGQVEQAVANIAVNAIQAMTQPGTVRATVERVRVVPPGKEEAQDFARIAVKDTGSGIRPEDLPHIFEPFFTTKQVGGGTGLGLAVTYGIVHDHGGFVDVDSKPDVGTTVSLYFPL